MKTFRQYLAERVTPSQLKDVEKFADRLFQKLDIDVEFTRHFSDRVNDDRNNPEITSSELVSLFKKSFKSQGKKIKSLGPDAQAVIHDIQKDLNMPFVLTVDKGNKELDLVAKTIMRKKDFKSPNEKIKV